MISIDASVAIKTIVEEENSGKARAIVAAFDLIIIPAHAYAEISEVIYRKSIGGLIDVGQARKALMRLPEVFTLAPLDTVMADAFDIAMEIRHSVYDCLYVATARRHGTKLVTADTRLLLKVAKTQYSSVVISLESFNAFG